MEAGPRSVKVIFEQSRRLIVPLFQRPYVWKEADQWAPLWHDIQTMADRLLEGKDVRPHFLGAVVLDHVRKATGLIETRTIIDGQQRLTTIQLVLEALHDVCEQRGDEKRAQALRKLTRNDDPMSEDDDEDFKVWPTNADREHFRKVMDATSPVDLYKAYGVKASTRPIGKQIADAYAFFYRCCEEWIGPDAERAPDRTNALYSVLRNYLQIVVIDLGSDDDAQMIFETLNARGTPLLPSDLVKNFLFHEIQKTGGDLQALYKKHWQRFEEDDGYWGALVGRGHARRARLDVFLQNYLTLKKEDDVEVGHLYAAYRDFVRDSNDNAQEHLKELHTYADVYREFGRFSADSCEGRFFARLSAMDIGTAYPLLLELFRKCGGNTDVVQRTLVLLESWLVRRMICQLNTRGYNRVFIDMLSALQGPVAGLPNRVRAFLLDSDAESRRWPPDAEFRSAWRVAPVYQVLVRERVRMVLEALEEELRTAKSEKMTLHEKLTIEHVMPQSWTTHWPLPEDEDPTEATERRSALLHSFGNLTLLTKKLNPAVSNGPWEKKRAEIKKHSLLRLNVEAVACDEWTEKTIEARARTLFDVARRIWPYPK